jgi:hypothetical protein
VAVDSAVLDEGPWDGDEQMGMEKCGLYLEGVEEDMRRGLYRAADQLEKQWRDWSALQTLVRLWQIWDDLLQNRAALLQQT